jgi:hypothetical protein
LTFKKNQKIVDLPRPWAPSVLKFLITNWLPSYSILTLYYLIFIILLQIIIKIIKFFIIADMHLIAITDKNSKEKYSKFQWFCSIKWNWGQGGYGAREKLKLPMNALALREWKIVKDSDKHIWLFQFTFKILLKQSVSPYHLNV